MTPNAAAPAASKDYRISTIQHSLQIERSRNRPQAADGGWRRLSLRNRHRHGVATKNLSNYLSWRRTMEALGAAVTAEAWIMGAASIGPYQHASQI